MPVIVLGKKDPKPEGVRVVDTTSRSCTWSRGLSPFLLGPCRLWGDYVSQNVENGWQYSKVYAEHWDQRGFPKQAWFSWAAAGWARRRADRYPAGRGRQPICSWWHGEALGYIEARRRIYIPLYWNAALQTDAFRRLIDEVRTGELLVLEDFDGYDRAAVGHALRDVVNDPTRKMGHAFVLEMMLQAVGL